MDLMIWVVFGALVGWLAGHGVGPSATRAVALSVVAGIVGALLGGIVVSPLLGIGVPVGEALHLPSLVVAVAGATVLTGAVHLLRRASLL